MAFRVAPIASSVLVLSVTFAAFSQDDAPKVDTYYLLGPNKTLTILPSAIGEAKGKSKLGGIAGSKQFVEFPGDKAELRLKTTDPQTFVYGVRYGPMPEVLPPGVYAILHKLEVRDGKRFFVLGDVTSYGFGAKARNFDPRGVPLNAAGFGSKSIQVEPRSPLAPGEYGFVSSAADPYQSRRQVRLYFFGVD